MGTPEVPIERRVAACDGERIDAWCERCMERVPSRSFARKRLRTGRILLNGTRVESSRYIRPGDIVELFADPGRPAYHRELSVLYVDTHCAVVLKPAGLLVSGNRHQTLENALPTVLPPHHDDPLPFPRPVHRLDYETAGPVVVARTHAALVALSHAFEARKVGKSYRAIVLGRLESGGHLRTPVEGREAHSEVLHPQPFRSLKTGWCTEVELVPHTGRTHQLRRHLAAMGHPILGDRKYGDGPVYRGNGLFLASTALSFPHPTEARGVEVEVPPPQKFASFRRREERRWTKWHPEAPRG